ncbi:unnamed protein product, partial [Polarella glacialis]
MAAESAEIADDTSASSSDAVAASEASAAELKARGNEAYGRGDCEASVAFWNQAIRRHVSEMQEGSSCLGKDSQNLERSIYLNLAQGYLKLGDPGKALRACQVVLTESPTDAK